MGSALASLADYLFGGAMIEPTNPFEGILQESGQESAEDIDGDQGIGRAEWGALVPHARQQVLLEVTAELELANVAVAMEADDTDKVTAWLDSAALVRVDESLAAELAQLERFEVRVVAPFVLCKRLF